MTARGPARPAIGASRIESPPKLQMTAAREALRETRLVLLHELADQLRSARAIIFALLNAVVPALIGALYYWAGEKMTGMVDPSKLGPDALAEAKKQTAEKLADFVFNDIFLAEYVEKLPWLIVIVFLGAAVSVPLLSFLMTFDVISSEVTSRSVRYDLTRARRGSYYAGKVLAHSVIIAATSALLFAVATGYAGKSDDFEWGAGLVFALRAWMLLWMYGSACVSLTILLSIVVGSPAASLMLGAVVWAVLLGVTFYPGPAGVAAGAIFCVVFLVRASRLVGGLSSRGDGQASGPWGAWGPVAVVAVLIALSAFSATAQYVAFLSPFSHVRGLLYPLDSEKLWASVAFYAVFTPLAIFGGQRIFAKRDL